jgi:hypothetical protein
MVRHRVQHLRRHRLKVCIVSDRHDRREPLAASVSEARALGAPAVLHYRNLVAPSTLHAIIGFGAADPSKDTQFNRTSLIVVAPVVQIKHRLCAAIGCSARR